MSAELWRDVRSESKARRARNRTGGAAALEAAGIDFETKNMGAHLIVSVGGVVVDFWPGTGKWVARGNSRKGRGVKSLVKWVQGHNVREMKKNTRIRYNGGE